jgi:hypothetical protein
MRPTLNCRASCAKTGVISAGPRKRSGEIKNANSNRNVNSDCNLSHSLYRCQQCIKFIQSSIQPTSIFSSSSTIREFGTADECSLSVRGLRDGLSRIPLYRVGFPNTSGPFHAATLVFASHAKYWDANEHTKIYFAAFVKQAQSAIENGDITLDLFFAFYLMVLYKFLFNSTLEDVLVYFKVLLLSASFGRPKYRGLQR